MNPSGKTLLTRREFVATSFLGAATLSLGMRSPLPPPTHRLLLIRFDTESRQKPEMSGFFEKMVAVHRSLKIPATFFCLGAAMELRASEFREFFAEVRNDPLFDLQNHTYSHLGLGYDHGQSVEVLRADIERSFALQERLGGGRPVGVSMPGTGGRDGNNLPGFDATEKSRAELDMLASLGVRMINTFHSGVDAGKTFINYGDLGHPEIMGFPSGNADNSWLRARKYGDPRDYILSQIKERGPRGEPVPVMFHDDTVWIDVNDRNLDIVRFIADAGRQAGFEFVTHRECLQRKALWQNFQLNPQMPS